jgi:hypothetical protein
MIPPTPEDLEQMYLEHDAFRERALQWDKNEDLYLREWQARKAELDAKYEERKLLQSPDDEQLVESWQPGTQLQENTELLEMSEIDLLER